MIKLVITCDLKENSCSIRIHRSERMRQNEVRKEGSRLMSGCSRSRQDRKSRITCLLSSDLRPCTSRRMREETRTPSLEEALLTSQPPLAAP